MPAPLSFLRGGDFGYSSVNLWYDEGLYWASKISSDTDARSLKFTSTLLSPQYNFYKGGGFSIRCVVQP